jgi:hypothetical protein
LIFHAQRATKEGFNILAKRGQKPEHRFGRKEILGTTPAFALFSWWWDSSIGEGAVCVVSCDA